MGKSRFFALLCMGLIFLCLPACGGCGGGGGGGGGNPVGTNQAPLAVLCPEKISGPAPLLVAADGSRSSDADGSISSFDWDFGAAGGIQTGSEASFLYSQPGTYTLTLTVTDDRSGTASATQTITVDPPASLPAAPPQTLCGPGSSGNYSSTTVAQSQFGSGATAYYLFEPDNPKPATAPVVIFLHGFGGTDPSLYQAWIDHLVLRGRIVIFPAWQVSGDLQTNVQYINNTLTALEAAFEELSTGSHVRPETEKIAVVGHSYGGIITGHVGTLAASRGLPVPKALMAVNAGQLELIPFTLEEQNYPQIPASTLLVCVAGDQDGTVGQVAADFYMQHTPQIPTENKTEILLHSDSYGEPALIAGHGAPTGNYTNPTTLVNALDYFGYWKWLDALCDTAFEGNNRDYWIGRTIQQTFMGHWSDGTAVVEASVIF